MQFQNNQISLEDLPSIEHISLTGLEQNYLTAELLASAIFWVILGGGGFTLIYFNFWGLPQLATYVLAGTLTLGIISSFVTTILGFKRKKYALRDHDIIYQSGLFWRNYTVLPFKRVQHAEVQQGPIDRIFELSSLKIYTAGGSSSDMTISGLKLETAQTVKQFILHQMTKDEEE